MSSPITPAGNPISVAQDAVIRAVTGKPLHAPEVPRPPAQTTQAPAKAADPKALQKVVQEAIDSLNEQMRANNGSLNFSMDAQLGRVVITVRDSNSGEVIRQIPDEAVLRVAHDLKKVRGLLLNKEA